MNFVFHSVMLRTAKAQGEMCKCLASLDRLYDLWFRLHILIWKFLALQSIQLSIKTHPLHSFGQ